MLEVVIVRDLRGVVGLRHHVKSAVSVLATSISVFFLVLVPASYSRAKPSPSIHAEIIRTKYHIPHIKGTDFRSLGFGVGYAYAEDNLCLFARSVIKVRGERSRYFGPDGKDGLSPDDPTNLESDIFYRAYLNPSTIASRYSHISDDAKSLLDGYVKGFNHYLTSTAPADRPSECRNAPWITPITESDLFLLMTDQMIRGSVRNWISAIVRAGPPTTAGGDAGNFGPSGSQTLISGAGGNSFALGREVSANKTGILLGDMISRWRGEDRFYEMQLTIPGQFNVMGVTLLPFPAIIAGFNQQVAWTHTLTSGGRSPLYELTLVPGDPLHYKFGGTTEPIVRKTVSVEVRDGAGGINIVQGSIYLSRYGPVIIGPHQGIRWSKDRVFAVSDLMLPDSRALDQWLKIDRASSVAAIGKALDDIQGLPWMNTVAADRHGKVLFSDVGVVPDVPPELIRSCQPSAYAREIAARTGMVILDGSQQDCTLPTENERQKGILPPASMLSAVRTDYLVSNNGLPRLANLEHPIDGGNLSAGDNHGSWNPRTRMGYRELEELIKQKPGRVTARDLQAIVSDNRDLAADLALDDLIRVCREQPFVTIEDGERIDIADACGVLAKWDRRDNSFSRGALLFRQIWHRMDNVERLWSVPFDSRDPIGTPRSLEISTNAQRDRIREDIGEAVRFFRDHNIDLGAPLGPAQVWPTNEGLIPLSGGYGSEGVLNRLVIGFPGSDASQGGPVTGSAYMQIVTWGPDGPDCHALLPYGESSNRSSVHYSDQALLDALNEWPHLPFSEAEIAAGTKSRIEFNWDGP